MHCLAVCKAAACSGITFAAVSGPPVTEEAGLSALTQSSLRHLSLIPPLDPAYHWCLFYPCCIIPMQSKAFLWCRIFSGCSSCLKGKRKEGRRRRHEKELQCKVFVCGGKGAECLIVPCEAELHANKRRRVRVRERCECYHSCKCGRTAGQWRAVWVTARMELKTLCFMGHQTRQGRPHVSLFTLPCYQQTT